MKLIKDKFKYPDLNRVENVLGRFYIDSRGQEVPSVTNVLSSTSDQSGIEEWKRRVGHEEAERIYYKRAHQLAQMSTMHLKTIYKIKNGK